jgi:hypothetical protein
VSRDDSQDDHKTSEDAPPEPTQPLPAFLRQPMSEPDASPTDNVPADSADVVQSPINSAPVPSDVVTERPEPAEEPDPVEQSAAAAPTALAADDVAEGADVTSAGSETAEPETVTMAQSPAAQESEPAPADPRTSAPEQITNDPATRDPATRDAAPAPKPRNIDIPTVAEQDFDAAPALLTASHARRSLSAERAAQIKPLLEELTALRDRMASGRRPGAGPAARG